MNPRVDAEKRAADRDRGIQAKLEKLRLPTSKQLLTKVRAYLLERMEAAGHPGNRVEADLKSKPSKDGILIILGPTIDRGPEPNHFHCASGARLSFGITVKPEGSQARLVSYRFDYRHDGASRLPLLRFELRKEAHGEPLREPLAHFHPGHEDIRLPTGLVDPFEVLDLLFFVIEPEFQKAAATAPSGT